MYDSVPTIVLDGIARLGYLWPYVLYIEQAHARLDINDLNQSYYIAHT